MKDSLGNYLEICLITAGTGFWGTDLETRGILVGQTSWRRSDDNLPNCQITSAASQCGIYWHGPSRKNSFAQSTLSLSEFKLQRLLNASSNHFNNIHNSISFGIRFGIAKCSGTCPVHVMNMSRSKQSSTCD